MNFPRVDYRVVTLSNTLDDYAHSRANRADDEGDNTSHRGELYYGAAATKIERVSVRIYAGRHRQSIMFLVPLASYSLV